MLTEIYNLNLEISDTEIFNILCAAFWQLTLGLPELVADSLLVFILALRTRDF